MRAVSIATCLLLGFQILAGQTAVADYQVLESNAPSLLPGYTFANEAVVTVPAGATVKLLALPGGTVHVIVGPHQGSVASYQQRAPTWWERLFGYDSKRQAPDDPYGGVRGGRR